MIGSKLYVMKVASKARKWAAGPRCGGFLATMSDRTESPQTAEDTPYGFPRTESIDSMVSGLAHTTGLSVGLWETEPAGDGGRPGKKHGQGRRRSE
jgi:hypothetical protein